MQMQTAGLNPISASLRTDITLARSWADLEELCEQIDDTYSRGDIDLAGAEELSVLAAAAASIVPEAPLRPTKVFVDGEASCPHCGAVAWWQSDSQIADRPSMEKLGSRQAA